VAYFKVLTQYLPDRAEETHAKSLSGCLGQGSKLGLHAKLHCLVLLQRGSHVHVIMATYRKYCDEIHTMKFSTLAFALDLEPVK